MELVGNVFDDEEDATVPNRDEVVAEVVVEVVVVVVIVDALYPVVVAFIKYDDGE